MVEGARGARGRGRGRGMTVQSLGSPLLLYPPIPVPSTSCTWLCLFLTAIMVAV